MPNAPKKDKKAPKELNGLTKERKRISKMFIFRDYDSGQVWYEYLYFEPKD